MNARYSALVALIFCLTSVSGIAAQLKIQDMPVTERSQAGYEAIGAHMGGVMFFPSVQIMENFDSNIFATKHGQKSDFITHVQPGLNFRTLNIERGFDAALSADEGLYKQHSKESYVDYQGRFSPYWSITHAMTLKGDLSRQKLHELRSDPDADVNSTALEPVAYTRTAGKLAWNYKRGKIGLALGGERAYLDFDNGAAVSGQSVINDDRNRFENDASAELSCDITDRTTTYWRSGWLNRDYKRPDFDSATGSYTGAKRNSNGAQSVIGLRIPLTHLIGLDANIGYRHQDFNDPIYKDIGTGIGRAALTWMATSLTTVQFDANRDVYETNQTNASGYVQSNLRTTVSHELRRNIILQASGGIGTNNYIGIDRDDDYRIAGLAAIYKMNRFLHWRMAYDYSERSSNVDIAEYDKHRVFLSSTVQF